MAAEAGLEVLRAGHGVTIWYVVAPYQGQEIISIQLVRLDT